MPNSQLSSNLSADVRAFLADVVPEAQLTDAPVNPPYRPLLLMLTKHMMAAFAFANSDISNSYEVLYGSFKRHYAEQQGKWDHLDLAFVFCVQSVFPHIDQFCSNVETDVYFCRKFVVPLVQPLGASLVRLPFLPLTPVPGETLRPPSAQTFLQHYNVPATLAKDLVVQHARSPEGIVEDCTHGEFGDPQPLTHSTTAPAMQTERRSEPVRLDSLEIRNFRAYRKPQTFTLGADVTVLYGPNGFGKTSFFDAVDFVVTGGIGRLELIRQSDFAKIARHLDSGSEEGTVSLTFLRNNVLRKITRSVGDRKHALLDGRPTDRKAILSELTCGDIPATDRVENFVSLFRASHLFSQEQQELTKGFQDDCCLSAEIISRMLALEDYANAVTKADKVRDLVQKAIADTTQEIRILTEQIATDKKELDRLGQTAKAHTNIEALDTEVVALRAKLEAVGIAITAEKPDVTMVRGWRAALESRVSQTQAATNQFSDLAKEVAGLPRTRAELAALQQQLTQNEQALNAAEEKKTATELLVRRAEQMLAELTAKRVEAQNRADLLAWVRNTQPRYARLVAQQRELIAELQSSTAALAQLLAASDKADGELRSHEGAAAQVAEKLKARRAELVAAKALSEVIPAWHANLTRLAAVLQSEQAQLKALDSLRTEERELAPQLAAITAEESRLARQIADAERSQSELRTLVLQLQGHIRTGTCPLCGQDHGSQDKLLQRIQKHVAADAASAVRVQLIGIRERAKQLAELVAANKQKQQSVGEQLATLKNERVRLEAEIANFTATASSLAVTVEADGPSPAEQVQALVTRLQREVADLDKQGQETTLVVKTARAAATDAKNAVAAKKTQVDERKATLPRLQDESNRLRADPRLTEISLDIEPGQLAELEKLNLNHLEVLKAQATKAEAEANQKKTELSILRQEAAALKTQLTALRTQLSNLQKIVTQITGRLEESTLPADTSQEALLAKIAEQSRLQSQLLALRDAASSLELAMDAATTAAALTTLQQNVRNREKAVEQTVAKRARYLPWLKYFEEVSKLVSSKRNEAVAGFTRQYGPRTSVIQRRLRSVYGFDEIEIRSRESTISVRVKRHGEELRPKDYFSQSQLQTLLLGLFLTACSSQTWSAFSPVFFDDPVTHFDDLNTYAFLDLLVGLLESEPEKRQFVVSTCDEKLLQLARQKFRHIGERAKFYRFTAIGVDGPAIEESS